MAVENSVLFKAGPGSVFFFIERLALLDRIFIHNHAWWTIYSFLPRNWFTFKAVFQTTEITAESADYHSERGYLFLIDRVAAIFLALSYWNLSFWNIALGLFVLSNVGFTIIFMEQNFDARIVSRVGTSNSTETEGEELVKERAETEDEDEESLQTDKNSDSRRTEEDQEGLETGKVKNFMSCFDQQLLLDVLFNLRSREMMFFMKRTPILLYLLTSRSFPLSFAIFVWYSSLLCLLSLITSQLAVHPTPIGTEYMFWIERTAMAFSGIYYVYGSHVSCWYLAICLFSLCNAVNIINLVAPEKAGRVVHEIISLCSPTCSSREISKGEELVKEQAEEEDKDDSDCCEMDDQEDQEAEKRLQIAILLIPFEQILMSSVLVYLTGSLSAWESATFFCLFVFICILGEHFFPNDHYLSFIDRVSSSLLGVLYFTGSRCFVGFAIHLIIIILSDVLFIKNEIGKKEWKEVQKNIDLCSKTCSPNPNPSEISDHEGEDDPQQGDQEAAEVKENDCCDALLAETLVEILLLQENILDHEETDDHELPTAAATLDKKLWMEIKSKFEGETEVKYNEHCYEQHSQRESETGKTDSIFGNPWKYYKEKCRKLEEEKSDLLKKLQVADSVYEHDQGVLHNFELHCRRWEEERNANASKLHAATECSESYRARLRDSEEVCLTLRVQNAELVAELNMATSTAHLFRQEFLFLEEQREELTAALSKATTAADLYRTLLHNV